MTSRATYNKSWSRLSNEDIRFIREHYKTKRTKWIANQLGRTPQSVESAYRKYIR